MIEAAPQGERRVTYKALNSETVAAARDAADAAGLTTEDWLTRAILENAHVANVPGAEPTTAAPAPPSEPTPAPSRSTFAEVTPTAPAEPRSPDARMEAMARHLRRAKAAADQSGMSVSEWLTQAIMESARAQHAHPRAANDRRENAQADPGVTVPGHTSDASMDPLQERLARIVTARRHESARNFRQTEQPMLLATRPQAKEGQRRFWPNLDQPHSGRPAFSWFWTAVLVILIAIAGLVWSLPYLPEPVSPGSANVAPPLNSVAEDRQATPPGTDQPKTTKTADTAKPKPVSKVALAAVARDAMPKPVAENVAWYKRAAEAGNHYAQFELAKLYIRGESVKRDPSEAARLLAIAARDGDLADAQYALGVMYERGIGVKKSLVEATLLYQRAADQGYVLALTQVGIAHLEGRGVKKDYAKARTYLERAAESGEMNAQYALGQMHEKGLGFKKDRVRALKWFILAAQRGHKLAAERLENISYKTSDEERERANELAREHNQRFKVSPN